jgi:hypothetical protein
MTAMGIIGIILVSVLSLLMLMSGAYYVFEAYFKAKSKFYANVCEDAAKAFANQNRELFRNIMNDASIIIPSMTKACMKTFEEDEEP